MWFLMKEWGWGRGWMVLRSPLLKHPLQRLKPLLLRWPYSILCSWIAMNRNRADEISINKVMASFQTTQCLFMWDTKHPLHKFSLYLHSICRAKRCFMTNFCMSVKTKCWRGCQTGRTSLFISVLQAFYRVFLPLWLCIEHQFKRLVIVVFCRATVSVCIVNQEEGCRKEKRRATYITSYHGPENTSKTRTAKRGWFKAVMGAKTQTLLTNFKKHNKTALLLTLTSSVLCQPWAELRSPFRGRLIQQGQEIVEYSRRTPCIQWYMLYLRPPTIT